MNVRSINGAAQVICDAMALNRVPATIARALDASGWLNTTEAAAELERLRLLLDAQPAELSEAQLDALIDTGNGALNDHYHERACSCSEWPNGCATNPSYVNGYWDTDAFAIGAAAVVGMWESMRVQSEAAELSRLRARVAELEAERSRPAPVIERPHCDCYATAGRYEADGRRARPGAHDPDCLTVTARLVPVEDPHDSPLHHTYTTGRDIEFPQQEAPRV